MQALYRAGKNPTRASFQRALYSSMNDVNKFALRASYKRPSKNDHWMMSKVQLQRFNGNTAIWAPIGKLIEGRPRSSSRTSFSPACDWTRGPETGP